MTTKEDQKISIHLCAGSGLIWNANDIRRLRIEHRILGSLIGTVSGQAYQNTYKAVPLRLLPEETAWLLEAGYAKLEQLKPVTEEENLQRKASFEEYEKRVSDEFAIEKRKEMEENIRKNAMQIQEAWCKKRSSTELPDLQQIIQEKLKNFENPNRENMPIQSFIRAPWKNAFQTVNSFSFPENQNQAFKFAVFKDLRAKGFYLTTGLKFGCDFLAYDQDPLLYHSSHVVICTLDQEDLQGDVLYTYNRLVGQVKKALLVAHPKNYFSKIDDQIEIEYCSFKWKSNSEKNTKDEMDKK